MSEYNGVRPHIVNYFFVGKIARPIIFWEITVDSWIEKKWLLIHIST